jgi:hypothetical protein
MNKIIIIAVIAVGVYFLGPWLLLGFLGIALTKLGRG